MVQCLQQLLTYNGFFNSQLEWITTENIQIVASMNPPSTLGRINLTTRFTSITRICNVSYSNEEQLQQIYRILLQPIIDYALPGHKTWSFPKNVTKLASTLVSIYVATSQKFTPDIYQHYLFTPRDITRLVISLARYIYSGNDEMELLEVVAYESQRLFQDRLVGAESRQNFQNILFSRLRADWNYQGSLNNTLFTLVPNVLAGKQLTNMKALTRIEFKDYENQVSKQLFAYQRDVRELNITLFPELIEQVARIERVLSQSGGSMLLAGRSGICYGSLVTLACVSLNYKVTSPKVSRSYSYKSYQSDIKQAIQAAVVQ
jgi:dynein heavy chain 2, cytosolic